MATKGRKPLPDTIKLVRGESRPSRFNPDQPTYGVLIECPSHLGEKQKEAWFKIVPLLIKSKVATEIDVFILEMICEKWVEWREAQDKINESGPVIASSTGTPIYNPFWGVANSLQKELRAMMTEFGMTPSSRTRIKTEKEGTEETSRFDRLQ